MVDEEPTTEAAVAAWISDELLARDPFVNVADASDEHRVGHEGCEAFPSRPGHLFAVLAASIGARRVLEVGGGLGYSTLWFASGVGPEGRVETIEGDATHAELLRGAVAAHGYEEAVAVHEGRDADLLATLTGPYDLIFYDAAIPGPELVDTCERLLRAGGALLASNIFLGRYVPNHPDLERGAQFRRRLLDSSGWLASFVNGKLLAVRR
jgi:predicted O-methyltransferase YrrM